MRPLLLLTIGALSYGAPGLTAQLPLEGLGLDQVLTMAREHNPRLRALEAAARATELRAPGASTLPDPMFQLGFMNFGIPELNTDMAMSMAPSLQLTQRLPFPGKLSLSGDVAEMATTMATASADEAWWDLRRSAAALFHRLYELDRRIEVMRETLSLLEDFQDVAKAMYSAGTGRQADVLRADVEVARMDGEIRQMEAARVSAAARLNALLDRPASTPIGTPVLEPLPLQVPAADELIRSAAASRPLLEHARVGVDRARTLTALANKQIWPDVTLGLAYGQGDRGMGTERMASAMLGFTLPVHAGSRQLAFREEMIALERLAEAELAAREADVDAQIREQLAELSRARSLSVLYRDEVIPEARATVESAFSSYRVGTVDFMTLVDAQMTVNRYEGQLFSLLADYGDAIAALESTIGTELPRTGPILAEEQR